MWNRIMCSSKGPNRNRFDKHCEKTARIGPRTAYTTKLGATSFCRVSQTSFRQSKKFRRADISKNSQSKGPQKVKIPSGNENKWLPELCNSWQESARKALHLSAEKCTLAVSNFNRSSNVPRIRKSGRRNCFGEPKQSYVKIAQTIAQTQPPDEDAVPADPDLPPVPPPRTPALLPAPPLPPRKSSTSTPQLRLSHLEAEHAALLQQLYSLALDKATVYLTSKYSPSSGYYSGSNSVSSCSPLPLEPEKAPVIMPSVRSTQVEKPPLQTAIALEEWRLPPPPYRSQPPAVKPRVAEPPSYSSSVQRMTTPVAWLQKPPLPLESASSNVDHQSPIPERKCESKSADAGQLRNYSPQEFKFFMEQHIENLIKLNVQRQERCQKLEEEMHKLKLSQQDRCEMRKMLNQKETNYLRQRRAKMNKSMFEKIEKIGVGAFGEVTLVQKVDSDQLYAMKTLRKADVLRKKQVAHVKAERDILAEADNEWVVKLYFSFQDEENLYFVMEYIPGGDLMSLLIKFDIFDEEVAKFYLAELTCAVESVHMMGFIHRDIKPDNILIDRDGHIKLTDFGLCTGFRWTHNSKYYEDSHNRQDSLELSDDVNCKCSKLLERRRRREHRRCMAHSLVGTPNYIAPEVLLRSGYTQLCDWWSVGVVLYEMLIGYPPFAAESPLETQYKIKNWQSTLKIPAEPKISPAAIDLILKLCTSPEERLGKSANELKQHPFLADINFELGVRKLTPPYIPKIETPTDTSNFPVHSDDESSTDSTCTVDGSTDSRPWHRFFEFTFRRFFENAGDVPLLPKMAESSGESPTRGAIYV